MPLILFTYATSLLMTMPYNISQIYYLWIKSTYIMTILMFLKEVSSTLFVLIANILTIICCHFQICCYMIHRIGITKHLLSDYLTAISRWYLDIVDIKYDFKPRYKYSHLLIYFLGFVLNDSLGTRKRRYQIRYTVRKKDFWQMFCNLRIKKTAVQMIYTYQDSTYNNREF